ncbi:hypothetical protein GA830_09050 [Mesorhizobium sp. NBSH29]|nr:hypothetical protein GA830_09050 [Mesorhizobium sp. NBSH29]
MRLLLRDRLTFSAFAALAVFMLALQGLLGGMAQGAMAASVADPLHIICASTGDLTVSHGGEQAPSQHECPCGALCRVASASAPAILSILIFGPQPHRAAEPDFQRQAQIVPLERRGILAEPRAPPAIS